MSLISASGQKKPSENIWSLWVLRSLPGVCEPNSGLTAACWTWSLNKFHIQISWKLGLQRAAMLGWPNCLGKNEPFKAAGSSSVNDLPKLHTSNTLSDFLRPFLAVSSRAKIRTACCTVYVIDVDLYRYTFIIFCPLLSSVCFLRNGHRIVLDRFDFWKEGSLAERPRSQRKGYRNIETLGVTVFSCEMMWEKVCWMGQFYAFLFLQNFKWDIQ